MKGLTAFEAIGNLNDQFIMSAVISEDTTLTAVPKRPSAFRRFMDSGWGVVAVCVLVAIGVMGGHSLGRKSTRSKPRRYTIRSYRS